MVPGNYNINMKTAGIQELSPQEILGSIKYED
jgi:hypothetical protein